MPFGIIRNDITNMHVDAIVNTANPKPQVGAGTDAMIHAKAGPELLEARKKIGSIPVGKSAITPGFDLDTRYVIHTVGPQWRGGLFSEAQHLRSCYDTALALALAHNCQSIAFPLISAGTYRFPKDKALQIALQAFSEFLVKHEMQIYLVVFNREVYQLSKKLLRSVTSYIDEHYVAAQEASALRQAQRTPDRLNQALPYAPVEESLMEYAPAADEWDACASMSITEDCAAEPPAPACPRPTFAAKAVSLKDLLRQTDAGFSETLMSLIQKTNKKDSEIYTKANITRQHFSKIRCNPDYRPTKATALALAIALELNLEQTKDLIGRAGFALTNSSKFDVIVRYFIEQGIYDIMEINMTLFEFDQSLLGS